MISFLGMDQNKLVELIRWYVENCNCPISKALIYRDPVSLIVRESKSVGTAETRSTTITSRVQPQVYEHENIVSWVDKHKTDPVSRLKVSTYHRAGERSDIESSQLLMKATAFVNEYLHSLLQYINSGNTAEISAWLDAWKIAVPETDPNINLPNGYSILKTVSISKHAATMKRYLSDKYAMQYSYDAFMYFLQDIATLQDSNQCDALLQKMLEKLSVTERATFFTVPLIPLDSESRVKAHLEHVLLNPLQLACLMSNARAVATLIRAGAQLRPLNSEDDDYDYEETTPPSILICKCTEIITAVVLRNVELFLCLKPLYLPHKFTTIATSVLRYIIFKDHAEFLEILPEFGVNIDVKWMLSICVEYNSAQCFQYLTTKYPDALASLTMADIDDLWCYVRANAEEMTDEQPNVQIFILELLKYKIEYQLMYLVKPGQPHLQEKIWCSHNAWALKEEILLARSKYVRGGIVNLHEQEAIEAALYQFLYSNPLLLEELSKESNKEKFIKLYAMGKMSDGDFEPNTMLSAAKRICTANAIAAETVICADIKCGASSDSNTDSSMDTEKNVDSNKRRRLTPTS